MNTLAAVAVAAGADFVEEGAVDLIHFGAIDFGETIGHVDFKIIID